jgi:hypothetical protein
MGRYCRALDRFLSAKPLAKKDGVWAGTTLMIFPSDKGDVAGAGEGIHYLYLRGGQGSFNALKPSNAEEAAEMKTLVEGIHAGKAPPASSGLMKHLSTFTPQQLQPVEERAKSLSFVISMGAELGVPEDPLPGQLKDPPRVFVRENAKEILVVEVWSEGHLVKVGVFPK